MKLLQILVFLLVGVPTAFASSAAIQIVTEEYPPYSYTEDGKTTGLATEVVLAVVDRLKLDTAVSVMEWKDAYQKALSVRNVLIYPIGRNLQREAQFKWVGEIAPPAKIYLFGLRWRVDRNQVLIRTLEDAKAYRIGTVKNDFREQYLISKGFEVGTHLIRGELIHNNMWQLVWGKVDLAPFNEMVAYTLAKRLGQDPLSITEVLELKEIPVEGNFMAFSRETAEDTVASFRTVLDQIKKDGTYGGIVAKYRRMILTKSDLRHIDK